MNTKAITLGSLFNDVETFISLVPSFSSDREEERLKISRFGELHLYFGRHEDGAIFSFADDRKDPAIGVYDFSVAGRERLFLDLDNHVRG